MAEQTNDNVLKPQYIFYWLKPEYDEEERHNIIKTAPSNNEDVIPKLGKIYDCPKCAIRYYGRYKYYRHYLMCPREKNKKLHECTKCSTKFHSQSALERHNIFCCGRICIVCEKGFKTIVDLNHHLKHSTQCQSVKNYLPENSQDDNDLTSDQIDLNARQQISIARFSIRSTCEDLIN